MNKHYFVLFIRTEFDHFFLSSTPVVKLVDVVVDVDGVEVKGLL